MTLKARLLSYPTLVILCLSAGWVSIASAAANIPIMQGKVQGDYARATFTWPTNTKFTLSQTGNQITISFDDAVTTDPSIIARSLSPYVVGATRGADNRKIVLTMNQAYPVRSFVSGTTIGVDVLRIDRPLAKTPPVPPAPAPVVEAKQETPPAPKPAPVVPKEVAAPAAVKPEVKPVEAPAPVEVAKAAPKTETVTPAATPAEWKEGATAEKQAAPAVPAPVAAPAPEAAPAPAASPLLAGNPDILNSARAKAILGAKAPLTTPAAVETSRAEAALQPKFIPTPEQEAAAARQMGDLLKAVPGAKVPEADTASEKMKAPLQATAAPVAEVTSLNTLQAAPTEPSTPEAAPTARTTATENAAPTEEVVAAIDENAQKLTVLLEKVQNDSLLHFPWKERVAVAAFTRGDTQWIIFNKPANLNMTLLKTVLPPYVTDISARIDKGHTILKLKTNVAVSMSAGKKKDSYEWFVTLSRHNRTPAVPITPEVLTAAPLKPNVFIAALETAPEFKMVDPVMGSELSIIPIYASGQGIFPERRFVDFVLPQTAQGIVVEPFSDQLRVVKLRNGIRLTDKDGVTLTQDLPPIDIDALLANAAVANSLFPYEKWKMPDYQAFIRKKQQLQHDIVKANDQKANLLRLELAKLFFSDGRHLEALAIINMIKRQDPKFYDDYQMAALRGAANFMLNRIGEAAGDFNSPSLADETEVEYWKQMAQVMLDQSQKSLRFAKFDKQYAKAYPPDIRQKLALVAADQMVDKKNFNTVYRIFDMLNTDKQMEPIQEKADFLIARIMAEKGDHKRAADKLNTLIENSRNEFLVSRARYLLYTMQYEIGEISRPELIAKLDQLRTIWRGDEVELNTLKLLADLYILEDKYTDGLRAMKDILTYYPTTPDAPQITLKMAQIFTELFISGKADDLKPLDALALYYEFKQLTPIGKQGDKMIQNLADRLAGVDLLVPAQQLLQHQVSNRLEGEERSRVGARLALLYLFDRQPRKALDVLEVTGFGGNPEKLETTRRHLAARAYGQSGQEEKALGILGKDFSDDAKQIRLDIFWDNKNWENVASSAEDMLASRKDITAPLTDAETQILLRLAVAYNFTGDTLQLKYVRDYFLPLMKNNPYRSQLAFLTNVRAPLNPDNINTLAKDISQIETFLDASHDSVQKQGLSAAIQ